MKASSVSNTRIEGEKIEKRIFSDFKFEFISFIQSGMGRWIQIIGKTYAICIAIAHQVHVYLEESLFYFMMRKLNLESTIFTPTRISNVLN